MPKFLKALIWASAMLMIARAGALGHMEAGAAFALIVALSVVALHQINGSSVCCLGRSRREA